MLQRSNSFESEDEEEEKDEDELQEEKKEGTKQKEDLETMEVSKQEGRVGGEEEIDERVKKDAVRLVFLFIMVFFHNDSNWSILFFFSISHLQQFVGISKRIKEDAVRLVL